jgi:hypothetical protein
MAPLNSHIGTTRTAEASHATRHPIAAASRSRFNSAIVVLTTWAVMVFLARIPVTYFNLQYFSYVVYVCILAALAGFVVSGHFVIRITVLRQVSTIALLVLPAAIGALRGLAHVHEIPGHMLTAWVEVALDERAYVRTFFVEPMMMPVVSVVLAGAIARGLDPVRVFKPALAMVWFFGAFVLISALSAGQSLTQLAEFAELSRSEFLYDGGLHANVYGMYCATVYAFILGAYGTLRGRFSLWLARATLAVATIVIFLTFSRSAVVAFVIVNTLHFWQTRLPQKVVLVGVALLGIGVVPTGLLDRFQISSPTQDADRFSSGRLEHIWRPLLPDVIDNKVFGQGHYSIYWTEAQQSGEIYPVVHSHNAFLDLLLDYGVFGAAAILSFYFIVWRKFIFLSRAEPVPLLRGFFGGASLAMVVVLLSSLNGRLTPEFPHFPIWLALGIAAGRSTNITRPLTISKSKSPAAMPRNA